MSKYRVIFDVRNPQDTGGTVIYKDVDVSSESIAIELAQNKALSSYPSYKNYTFRAKQVKLLK